MVHEDLHTEQVGTKVMNKIKISALRVKPVVKRDVFTFLNKKKYVCGERKQPTTYNNL